LESTQIWSWTADPILNQTIGPYRILRKIGEGGMGIVLEAEQREPIRRCVAFRPIKRGMDTQEVIARIESERQALALAATPTLLCSPIMLYCSDAPCTSHTVLRVSFGLRRARGAYRASGRNSSYISTEMKRIEQCAH
jgi:hypothetical protein